MPLFELHIGMNNTRGNKCQISWVGNW